MTKRDDGTVYRNSGQGEGEYGTVGSVLDEVGYIPLGRRILVGGRSADRREGLIATAVSFHSSPERIVLEFSNGCTFTIPARLLRGLAEAVSQDIAAVELKDQELVWSCLGVRHAISALLLGQFGCVDLSSTEVDK